jgi:hypothetical protein
VLTPQQPIAEKSKLPYLRPTIWLLVMVVLPTLLVMLLLSKPRAGRGAIALQNTCLVFALLLAAAAGFDWLRARRATGSTFTMLAFGAGCLIAILIIWNKLFRHYIDISGYARDTFRSVFHTIHAPLYGRVQISRFSWWWIATLAAAALLLWDVFRNRGNALEQRTTPWRIFLLQVLLTITLAGTETPLRIHSYFASYASYADDVQQFTGFGDVLRNYVERMPQLSYFASHYPPGFALLFMTGKLVGSDILVKLLCLLLPALTIFPLHALAGELQLSRRATALAAVLMATSAGVLIFPTINAVAILMLPACTCIWLLLRSLNRGGWWNPIAFGLCFAIYVLLSFASYMIALLMGLLVLIAMLNKSISPRRVLHVLSTSVSTFALFFALLHLICGFNIIDCFRTAHAMHLKNPGHGFDHPLRYLFRATGGILAYLVSTSMVIPILAIAAIKRTDNDPPLRRAFTVAAILGLLAAGFSGMSYFETERLWLIFTPALAIVAGAQLEQRSTREGHWLAPGAILMALTFSISYEWVIRHHLSGVLIR